VSTPRRNASDVVERLVREEFARQELAAGEEQLGSEIGFVFTSTSVADDTHAFYGPVVSAARRRASSFGCDILYIAPTTDSWLEASSVERCINQGAAGLVVFGGADGNPDVLSRRFDRLPVVFVEYDTIGGRSAHVGMDNEEAFGQIVTHLATLGRQRIATITGLLDAREGADRLSAYRSILQRIGYEVRRDYVQVGNFEEDSGYDGMKRLLALDEPPDAVAAASDVQAVGAIAALEEAGLRCPENVAVTGFDDAEWAATMRPALTTVRQPASEMGVAAVDSALAMIADPALAPPTVLLPGQLVVRESCGA
jgi:LacI family transcriptional regulator